MVEKIKKILVLLRFHFGIFLLPVFLYSLSTFNQVSFSNSFFLFLILYFLVYPSSNGYNSLQDDDKGSIGGIKNPPKCPKEMYLVTLILDAFSLILTSFLNFKVALLIFFYIIVSRLYSYRKIRLKKYPILSFLIVSVFQGSMVYLMVYYLHFDKLVWNFNLLIFLSTTFLMIGATYPLTQIYQHIQDKEDGVKTISMLLGIRGTFYFSTLFFLIFTILMVFQLLPFQNSFLLLILFAICFLAPLFFFNFWMLKVFKDEVNANFENTMKMNIIASTSFIIFFLLKIIIQIV